MGGVHSLEDRSQRCNGRTIRDLIETHARNAPGATSICAPGRADLTYAGLLAHIDETVRGLRAFGLRRHDRVAIVLANGPEAATAFLSVACAATSAPLDPTYRAEEYDFHLGDLDAKALVVAAGSDSPSRQVAVRRGIPVIELAADLEAEAGRFRLDGPRPWQAAGERTAESAFGEISPRCGGPEDAALVLHTSGTTSRPKMVPLTHANLCVSAGNVRDALSLSRSDCCMNVMPLFHIHGLVGALLSSICAGASIICTPGFLAPKFFEWMDQCAPTWYTAVPTMHQAIVSRAADNRDIIKRRPLRFIRSSSSPMPPQVMAQLERVFAAPLIESYGMTEAAHQITSNPLPPGTRKPGSVGVPAGPEIAVMDEGGGMLPAGATGEIVVRGANVTKGYENNAAANEAAFADGWLRTGDQGRFDEEGYLFLTGRIKEIINRAGEKISPREIDEVLMDHPAVLQAVTFAIPDDRLGEDVGAAVVLREGAGASEMEIRGYAASRLADFKVPRAVIFLKEIPKGPTGKPQRIGLAEKLGLAGTKGPAAAKAKFVAPRTAVEERLARIWAGELGVDRVGVKDDFFELGGYSLLAARIFDEVYNAFGRRLPLAVLFEAPTIEKLAAYVGDGAPPAVLSSIVTIQKAGSRLPFFCMANYDAFIFANLARLLGPEQPFYGLHPQGIVSLEDGAVDVKALATEYVKRIRGVQPQGPYLLGGRCSSGFVAYEAAQQLRRAGEGIALLVLLDTPGPWRVTDRLTIAKRRMGRFADHMRSHAVNLWRLSWTGRREYIYEGLQRLKRRLKVVGTRQAIIVDKPVDRAFWRILKEARKRYRPEPFEGNVLIFLSPEKYRQLGSRGGRRWRELVHGETDVYEVDAIHDEMLSEPHVRTIAEVLEKHFKRISEGEKRDSAAAPKPQPNARDDDSAVPPGGDKRATGRLDDGPTRGKPEFIPPRTPFEEKLAGIWAQVLRVEPVGVTNGFLELGGDSLLAQQVISRIREAFGVYISLLDFFEAPTVASLAAAILQKRAELGWGELLDGTVTRLEKSPEEGALAPRKEEV